MEPTPVPGGRPVRFDLTWNPGDDGQAVDLDIGCFYWATDGGRGAIQTIDGDRGGGRRSRLEADRLMTLSSDRTEGGTGGERLTLRRPGSISFLVVHASIYRGAPDFRDLGAHVAVRSGNLALADLALDSPAPGLDWCAVLVMGAGDSGLHLVREERYFRSAFHADRHYGLGLDWNVGHKAPGRVASNSRHKG